MRRRSNNAKRSVMLLLFAAPLVAAVACSFPDLTFGPPSGDDGGTDPETSRQEASTADVTDAVAADVVDGKSRSDAEAVKDVAYCESDAAVKCDCDDDGYADEKCDVDAAGLRSRDGAPLLPGDCDDRDQLRHPGQGYVKEPTADGDWNCDKHVDRDPPPSVTCQSVAGLGCTGAGFKSTVPCGEEADYYVCTAGLLSCTPMSNGKVTENCK